MKTCSSTVLLPLLAVFAILAVTGHAGTVSGDVRYTGAVPENPEPDNTGRHRPLLQTGADGALANVVVWLTPVGAEIAPSPPADDMEAVRIEQEDYEFVPRVVAVRAGQKVSVGNYDPANHNVRTVARNPENSFNVMTPTDDRYVREIHAEPSDRPIRLACDIHPWMGGWIYVFDHARYTVTNENGNFAIENVAPGTYRLAIQQPDGRLNAQTEIAIADDRSVAVHVQFTENNLRNQQPGAVYTKPASP